MEFTNQTILFGIFDSSSSVEKKIKKKMEITNFDFSPSDLNLLKTNGFSSVDDFQGFFMRLYFFKENLIGIISYSNKKKVSIHLIWQRNWI